MERDDRGNGIKIKNRDHDEERHPAVAIGEVGYIFWKQFDVGWYKGEVIEIRPGAAKGKDRRCQYTDGDKEDLSVPELRTLAKLLDRKLKKIRGPTKPDFHNSRPKVSKGGCLRGTTTPRQYLCPKVCVKSHHDRRR